MATLRRLPSSAVDLANQERRLKIAREQLELVEADLLLDRNRFEADVGLALVELQQAVLAIPARLACHVARLVLHQAPDHRLPAATGSKGQ